MPPSALLAQHWKIYYDSTALTWNKNWDKTISLLEKAESTALMDLGIYDPDYLTIINDLGIAYWQVKNYPSAENYLNKALELKLKVFDPAHPEIQRAKLNLGTIYLEEGNYSKAGIFYNEIIRTSTDTVTLLSAYRDKALIYEQEYKYDSALQYLIKAAGKLHAGVVDFQLKIPEARIYRKTGNSYAAIKILKDILVQLKLYNNRQKADSYIAEAYSELGLAYEDIGAFHDAEKNLLNAHQIHLANKQNNIVAYSASLNNLSLLYQRLGSYEKSMIYLEESWQICEQYFNKRPLSCATVRGNMATVYLHLNRLDDAIQLFEEVLNIYKSSDSAGDPKLISAINNLSTLYRKKGNLEKAENLLNNAFLHWEKLKNPDLKLLSVLSKNMGVLKLKKEKFEEAEKYFSESYSVAKTIYGNNSVALKPFENDLAVVYLVQKKIQPALDLFRLSLEKELRMVQYVFPNLSEEEKVSFYETLKHDFERFNSVVVDYAPDNTQLLKEMFQKQLIIKSLFFNSSYRIKDYIEYSGNQRLQRQYRMLLSKRKQLGRYYETPNDILMSWGISIKELEKEIDELEKEIALATSSDLLTGNNRNFQWKELQQKLEDDEALVEIIRFRKYDNNANPDVVKELTEFSYGFTDSIYYAALITTSETTEKPHLVVMKEGRDMESRFLKYYRNTLNFQITDKNSFNFYWEPIKKALKDKRKVYVSNDGVYNTLNLNIIKDPEDDKFLIEKYDIRLLLNPGQLKNSEHTEIIEKNAMLVGDPNFRNKHIIQGRSNTPSSFSRLPGTREEIITIQEMLDSNNWNTATFLGNEAQERRIKESNNSDIIHIATHGFFSDEFVRINQFNRYSPFFKSGLVLNPPEKVHEHSDFIEKDDGYLTAFEVMNLNLQNTSLVVLSACKTALGTVEHGEGVYGLQRSFLSAGAENLIISLWKVDDIVTKDLMIKFYKYFLKGTDIYTSLKQAQLDQLRETPDPNLWGAFILVSR